MGRFAEIHLRRVSGGIWRSSSGWALRPRPPITIPTSLINYKRVTLTYITHSEGGLTEKDFAGAAQATHIAAALGGS